MNSTRILRRCEKYLEKYKGNGRQVGYSKLSIAAGCDGSAVSRLRDGRHVSDVDLERLDKHLTASGY